MRFSELIRRAGNRPTDSARRRTIYRAMQHDKGLGVYYIDAEPPQHYALSEVLFLLALFKVSRIEYDHFFFHPLLFWEEEKGVSFGETGDIMSISEVHEIQIYPDFPEEIRLIGKAGEDQHKGAIFVQGEQALRLMKFRGK